MTSSALDRLDLPLRTDRLTVRAATAADADAVWRYRRLDEVNHWLGAAPADVEAFRVHFTDAERLAITLLVELPGVGVIGDVMVRVEDAWSQAEVRERAAGVQAELGWAMDPAHQGRGYATEAVRAVIAGCFADLGLRRIHAACFAANEPSWRMMERLGMRREALTRSADLHRSGVWMDGMDYALLAAQWRADAS